MGSLYDVPSLVLCAVLLAALLLSIEAGHRLGCRAPETHWDASGGAFLSLSSATMALLGLLLAFSFSMSVTRHDARQLVILKEAKVIGTVYMRSDFLSAEQSAPMKALLKSYVDQRLAYHSANHDDPALPEVRKQTDTLQRQLWAIAAMADNYREPKAVQLGLLSSAVNDMSDAASEAQFARDDHVPPAVIWLLFVVTLVSGAMAGYAFGARRQRNWLAFAGFAVMIVIVVYTILDLDRPLRGLIQVDQAPMLSLKAGMR